MPKSIPNDALPETYPVQIDAMAYGGSGLARAYGRTIFVPYTIPGEHVQVRTRRAERQLIYAEGVHLLEGSADRVFPQCQHFGMGRCWGCQWQHIAYPIQLLLKQEMLADHLERLGNFSESLLAQIVHPTIPSPDEWHYLHHITFERGADGTLGLARAADGEIEAIAVCEVLHPELQALYESLDIDYEQMARLTLMRGSDGATMLILHMNSEDLPELSADMPTSVNVLLPDQTPVNLVGDTLVRYRVGDQTLRVTAGSFFRANVPQVATLTQTVLTLLAPTPQDAVLDLYGGVGTLSVFIAPHVGLLTLIESYPPAATDADENLSAFEHVGVIEGDVEDVLETLEETYTVAVIDPPEKGLGKVAREQLAQLKTISRLVYVSSHPATFARDAAYLHEAGYTLDYVQAIDFAPHRYELHAIALFRR